MAPQVSLQQVQEDPLTRREVELVERKGLGHPDSISDGVAESVSRALSREYRDRFGEILHHNTDEVQLVAGSSEPCFGGGEVIEPVYILLAGRATKEFDDEKLPVDRIALEAAKDYVKENFKVLDPGDIELESRIGETSTDLKTVFNEEVPLANDTSFGVGHAPLSDAEKAVKKLENRLHTELTGIGEDVKVMGLRRGDTLETTVAAAAISSRVEDLEQYLELKDEVKEVARETVQEQVLQPEVHVNTADEPGEDSVYLTVTGTSAEMGDDGSVGRGNRVNGLITPHRSMSLEAASGKNPVTHVGKIYNLLADSIAREVHDRTGEFAGVKLLSRIGSPIDEPQEVEIETAADESVVEEVVGRKFDRIGELTERCVEGEVSTF